MGQVHRSRVVKVFTKRIDWLKEKLKGKPHHPANGWLIEEMQCLEYAMESIDFLVWLKQFLSAKGIPTSYLHSEYAKELLKEKANEDVNLASGEMVLQRSSSESSIATSQEVSGTIQKHQGG